MVQNAYTRQDGGIRALERRGVVLDSRQLNVVVGVVNLNDKLAVSTTGLPIHPAKLGVVEQPVGFKRELGGQGADAEHQTGDRDRSERGKDAIHMWFSMGKQPDT